MSGLLELAERCEQALGPDRELDILIGYAVDLKGDDAHLSFRRSFDICGMAQTLQMAESHQNIWRTELPRYTASIDAALTLVPNGWTWLSSNRAPAPKTGRAYLYNNELHFTGIADRPNPAFRGVELTAATPALALAAAGLRAQAATP